jgi:hypothetical protein
MAIVEAGDRGANLLGQRAMSAMSAARRDAEGGTVVKRPNGYRKSSVVRSAMKVYSGIGR